MNQPDHMPVSARFFGDVQKYLTRQYGLMTTVGIGTCVNSTERIAQSYMEAVSALDYRFVKGNGTVIEFREVLGPAQRLFTLTRNLRVLEMHFFPKMSRTSGMPFRISFILWSRASFLSIWPEVSVLT
jgi:hypothetical protein